MKQLKNIQFQEKQIYKLLSEIKGLNFRKPDGAFYFYLDITKFNINSEGTCKKKF